MSLVRNVTRCVPRQTLLQNVKPMYGVSKNKMALKQTNNQYYTTAYQKNVVIQKASNVGILRTASLYQNYQGKKHQSNEAGGGGDGDISKRISGLVSASDVVVFMKGIPSAPRCGFSNAVCQIFRMHNVEIDSHDVLADEDLRQGIKEYSNWPTIPQVYFKGEFIGGCDILLQMHQSGELIEELEKIGIKSALLTAEESKDKTDDK